MLYFLRYDRALFEQRLRAGPIAETQRSQQLIQAAASTMAGPHCVDNEDGQGGRKRNVIPRVQTGRGVSYDQDETRGAQEAKKPNGDK